MRKDRVQSLVVATAAATLAGGVAAYAVSGGSSPTTKRSSTQAQEQSVPAAAGKRTVFHGGWPGPELDADVRGVLGDIQAAVEREAPGIADPIIGKALSDGKITKAQADQLKRLARGERPDRNALDFDADVGEVWLDVKEAIGKRRAELAKPIIDKAEADGKITKEQAEQLRDFGTHVGPRGGFRGGPHELFQNLDADVRAVLEDIRAAVAKQVVAVAGPIIDKAQRDGKITKAQADRLREVLQGAVPFVAPPRHGP